jgi:putative peptidoglycan lipid II flippase
VQPDKILRSASLISALTLLSRAFGMVRDICIAYFFGTSLVASAFFIAFTLPNLFRRLFGEGALSAAFVPVFVETQRTEGQPAAHLFARRIGTLLGIVLLLITLLGILLFTLGLEWGSLQAKWLFTFELARIMFPYLIFICLAALAMGLLHAGGHFFMPALSPTLLNLTLIGAMLLFFPAETCELERARLLALAVLLSGALQLGTLLPPLKKQGACFRPAHPLHDPKVSRVLTLMAPAALGVAITQLNVVLDRIIALWIGDWAPAALFYSERMIYFPLGLIATALGSVLLPTFSRQAADADPASMTRTLQDALRHMLLVMLPATLGLFWLATPILEAIFDWQGSFNTASTALAARSLMAYAPGLLIFSAAKLVIPAFYALQDTRTPVRIGLWTVGINLTLNLLSVWLLPTYWKHAGMALSTVLAEAAGLICLLRALDGRLPRLGYGALGRCLLRLLWRAVLMAMGSGLFYQLLSRTLAVGTKSGELLSLAGTILLSVGVYLWLVRRLPEWQELRNALARKSG